MVSNHPPRLEKLTLGTEGTIGYWSKKTRIKLIRSTKMRLQRTRLNLIIFLLLISFRPKPPKRINTVVNEVI